ncbi:MAG TPA: TraB/GumN family protein [Spirochaetia bacterium]|nr:TraB/GumN family protein [Spirochaetia bacterium]
METTNETVTRVRVGNREIILVGTAHVSRESVAEVSRVIHEENPGRVCVEIDDSRYQSIVQGESWSGVNIYQVIRQRKGFLLLGNLVLSSFQKRMGLDLGVRPGEEMIESIRIAESLGIPVSMCDRDIQVTLRRAWSKSTLWGKNKMLAALLSSVFTSEKLSAEEIEALKQKSALEGMMEELAGYLPAVKEVLIDERDRYLATRIFETTEERVVAVVGAGHVPGIVRWIEQLSAGTVDGNLTDISSVPPRGKISRALPWAIPVVVAGLLVLGFFRAGWQMTLHMALLWVLVHGTLSALGALVALAHPLTILVAFVASPLTSLNPTIGVGLVTGLLEAVIRKPRVQDVEMLQEQISSVRGFFKNRITHILLVFFLSSVGSAIGTFVGIPFLTALLAK